MKSFKLFLALFLMTGFFYCSPSKKAHKYFSQHPTEFAKDCNNAFQISDSVVIHHRFDTTKVDGGKPYIIVGEDTFSLPQFDSLLAKRDSVGKVIADSFGSLVIDTSSILQWNGRFGYWEANHKKITIKCPTVPCICDVVDTSHYLSREKMLQIILYQQKDSLQTMNTKYLQEKIDKGSWKLKAIVTWLILGIVLILYLWLKFK